MTIELNDNVRMTAALGLVAEGKYFDALCLFARVDSYESMLNQIDCLCHLRNNGYAVELYRRFLAKYYFTHNCYRDLNKVSSQTVDTLGFFDSELNSDVFDENKISADEKLLGNFETAEEDFDEEEFYDEFDEPLIDNGFCDVHSSEYFFRLIQRIQDESEKGNLKKSRELIAELMEFDSDDEAVLEGQMLLCLAERNYERGAEFADRFAALEQAESYRGIAVAIGLLSNSDKHKNTLEKMLARLIEISDEIPDSDLIEYVEIAESRLDNNELTVKLAELLYARHKYVGCDALRSCARVFCNMGLKKQARDATLTLLNAVPWDSYAAVLLRFIDSDVNAKLDKPFSNLSLLRHLDVPTQLGVIAEYHLIRRMESMIDENCVLHTDDYRLLHCIANVCKTHVYRGNSEKFVNDATVLATILFAFEPQNDAEFYDFAEQQLCSFMPEAPVQKDILLRLLKLGYRDKLLITANQSYYPLNLSQLTVADELFLDAFSLCAVLQKVDARRLQRNYLKVKEIMNLDPVLPEGDLRFGMAHKLAYCLLAVSYKDFTKSSVADYFSDGEDELYRDYKAHLTN